MSLNGKRTGNPTSKSNRSARRRAREAAASSQRELTLDELFERDRGYCHICRLPVPRAQASKEHVVPVSKGGTSAPGNTKLAHKRCNSRKGARVGPKRKGLRRSKLVPKPKSRMTELGVRVDELPDDVF
jgi:5-methylcytosine-specific restriction endonuclease McrA